MLLVDGYNLLFAIKKPDGRRLEQDRKALIEELATYAERTNQRMCIFFDRGGPRRERRARIEIAYMADGTTADDMIVAALAETNDRTAYRVVSSDRAIRRAAEARKVESVESLAFWRELRAALDPKPSGEPDEKSRGISSEQADYWMNEFGIGEDPR